VVCEVEVAVDPPGVVVELGLEVLRTAALECTLELHSGWRVESLPQIVARFWGLESKLVAWEGIRRRIE